MGEDPLTRLTSRGLDLGLEVKAHPLQRALYLKLMPIETSSYAACIEYRRSVFSGAWIEHYCTGYVLFNQSGRFIR